MMLDIVRNVLASLVKFSNNDDLASNVTLKHKIFVTKIGVAKTAADRGGGGKKKLKKKKIN